MNDNIKTDSFNQLLLQRDKYRDLIKQGKFYPAEVVCDNCFGTNMLHIPYEVTVKKYVEIMCIRCSRCQCKVHEK